MCVSGLETKTESSDPPCLPCMVFFLDADCWTCSSIYFPINFDLVPGGRQERSRIRRAVDALHTARPPILHRDLRCCNFLLSDAVCRLL